MNGGGIDPLPFTTANAAFAGAFNGTVGNTMGSIFSYLSAPAAACVVLWVIIQGIMVMRGDLDTRRGVIRIVRLAVVYSLVASAANYTSIIVTWFETDVPTFIKEVTGGGYTILGDIPTTLDIILQTTEAEFHQVAGQISSTTGSTDSGSFQTAQTIFYFTLWTIFAFYEVAGIMTDVLVAVGPVFLIGYLFDGTRQIAERWIGQLLNYAILLLLIYVVATLVLITEYYFIQAYLVASLLLQPVSSSISDFYDLDIFMATGDFIVLSLPIVASFIAGGLNSGRGEGQVPFSGGGRGGPSMASPTGTGAGGSRLPATGG